MPGIASADPVTAARRLAQAGAAFLVRAKSAAWAREEAEATTRMPALVHGLGTSRVEWKRRAADMNCLREMAQPITEGTSLDRQGTGLNHRLRVIYADLSEFLGTTSDWEQVRDGILSVQVEERPGDWVTLHGHDRYFVCSCGDICGDTDGVPCNMTDLPAMTAQPLNRHERAGKLVANDVWQRAKVMMARLPDRL